MFRIPSSLRFIGGNSKQIYSSKGKVLISGRCFEATKMFSCSLCTKIYILVVCSSARILLHDLPPGKTVMWSLQLNIPLGFG